jgi:hypothetical protein
MSASQHLQLSLTMGELPAKRLDLLLLLFYDTHFLPQIVIQLNDSLFQIVNFIIQLLNYDLRLVEFFAALLKCV